MGWALIQRLVSSEGGGKLGKETRGEGLVMGRHILGCLLPHEPGTSEDGWHLEELREGSPLESAKQLTTARFWIYGCLNCERINSCFSFLFFFFFGSAGRHVES